MNSHYYELSITPHEDYELFVELVLELTCDAIEEDQGTIIIRSENDLQMIEQGVRSFAAKINIPCDTDIQKKKNEDWIQKYRQSIKPIRAGAFYIHPTWLDPQADAMNIAIDPALAFGSGHHETTYSCLEAIDTHTHKEAQLLDVGTGSGILAIAATKKGAICDICDTDPLAVDNAKVNFSLNNLSPNRSWVGSIAKAQQQYSIIVANIVADVLVMIASDLKNTLKSKGLLILSGILTKYRDKVLSKFHEMTLIQQKENKEWTTLVLQKGE